MAHGMQVRNRRRAPRAILLRHLVEADAFLHVPVEIVVARIARLRRGVDEHLRQGIGVTQVGHRERAEFAMQVVATAAVAFVALEVRQHRIPVPTGRALRGPVVVIARVAADVAHRIDRTRTAEHLAARPPQRAVVELRFGRGVVIPVHALLADQLGQARGHVDEGMPVARAGFEQQHAHLRVRGQAIGEHAAGRTGTDDDVVESVHAMSRQLVRRR